VKFVTNMIESFSEIPILNFKATQQQERKVTLLLPKSPKEILTHYSTTDILSQQFWRQE
jgi:hypothetical protein